MVIRVRRFAGVTESIEVKIKAESQELATND